MRTAEGYSLLIPCLLKKSEGYDRRYYSGFIGWLDPDGRTDLYVNLRCMHIEEEQLTLYAGGGLLASSELNDEWLETEKKLQTMRRIIVPASLHDPQPITS